MKVKQVVLGAATAIVLVGSLLGVGCSSSKKNTNATTTPGMMETPNATTTAAMMETTTPEATGTEQMTTATPAKTATPY